MRYEFFRENVAASELGILLPNHLASSLDDSTGDKAQLLSEATGLPVLAFERPGTADQEAIPSLTPESYAEDAARRAEIIGKVLDGGGIDRLIVVGNSGSALDALAITAPGNLPVEKIVSIEPAGFRIVSRTIAYQHLREQVKGNKKTVVEDEDFKSLTPIGDIRPPASLRTLGARQMKEIRAYGPVYRSEIGLVALRSIASDQPAVDVNLFLADRSAFTTEERRASMVEEFDGTSVHIRIMKNAYHAFADPNHHFLHMVTSSINPLLDADQPPSS